MVNHPNRRRTPFTIPNPDTMAYDAYIDSMCEVAEAKLTLPLELRQVRKNWHDPLPGEPPCGPDEWRQKDRQKVIKINSMGMGHLVHCVRFASTRNQHRSKLAALQAELKKRQGGVGRLVDLQPAPRKHAWARGNSICLVCGAPKSEDAPPFCEVSDC